MRSFVLVTIAALAAGQAAAALAPARVQPYTPRRSVSSSCETVPQCGKGNVGVACTTTCQDNPGGERVIKGSCKTDPVFGSVNCVA